MVFTGDIVDMDFGKEGKYLRDDFHPDKLRIIINKWQTVLTENGGWNTVYMDNHDSGRSLSRFGSDLPKNRAHAAKMLAIHLCSVSGTLFLLQGQEIGMANIPRDWTIEDYIDVEGRNYYNSVLEARGGDASKMQDVLDQLRLKARDNGRLPMQWDSSPNAGFTSSETKPWMRVNDDYTLWNVESQVNDYQSVLCFWKKILGIRKEYLDLFVYGTFEPIPRETYGENIIGYKRQDYLGNQKAVVLLNFSDTESQVPFDVGNTWRILLSNFEDCDCTNGKIVLHPYHGVILCNWN
jgi:alpha-glucosidase